MCNRMRLAVILGTVVALPSVAVAQPAGTDPQAYPGPAWSPYLVGGLIGVLSWLTFALSAKPIGASTAYARIAGLLGKLFAPRHTGSLKYFQDTKPKVDWEVMFVLGAVGGAFLAAWHGDELTGRWVPAMWEARFGEGTIVLRLVVAFIGGTIMAFGARLAGGCTSGHGISGTLQLSVGSWIAVVCFFIGGILVAIPMFRL